MRNLVYLCASAIVLVPAGAPALAQSAPQQQQDQQKDKSKFDPNEVVCEKQMETGSRLSSHRVCMTRNQWAEQRRLDRQEVDRVQTQRTVAVPQ
jgi:invasion protein IalB